MEKIEVVMTKAKETKGTYVYEEDLGGGQAAGPQDAVHPEMGAWGQPAGEDQGDDRARVGGERGHRPNAHYLTDVANAETLLRLVHLKRGHSSLREESPLLVWLFSRQITSLCRSFSLIGNGIPSASLCSYITF